MARLMCSEIEAITAVGFYIGLESGFACVTDFLIDDVGIV